MNSETREELKRIQSDLRKPFTPEVHSIRELPGRGYWAFVPHHEYRERLDEVCPEWESSYTDIEQIASDVICKCTIKMLGISKQAIGSVPLVAAEKNGKDVSRGSAADRVAAEAFKNACEAWGVGRYLDDQGAVARYLNSNATKLDYETRNKLRPLADYLRSKGELPPVNSNTVVPKLDNSVPVKPASSQKVISEAQIKRLFAIARSLDKDVVKSIVKSIAGVESSADIPVSKYDALIDRIQKEVAARIVESPPTIDLLPKPQADAQMLRQEIASLLKRKNISIDASKAIIMDLFNTDSVENLTDPQLYQLRDYLASRQLN